MADAQISSLAAPKKQITAASFAAKFKSKREVYLFLTLDCKAYLPCHPTVTI
jgi:hypothetical protein